MMANIMKRFSLGFCCSVGITVFVHTVLMLFMGTVPMLPEYVERFADPVGAYSVELILIGCMSGITSAGTVLFESKRLGLLIQSILFLAVMLGVWIPVACFVWGFNRYLGSMISTILSIIVTYGICWGIQYRHCVKDIEDINMKLKNRQEA